MLEFLFGYSCGIITLIFLAALDARKKREKRERKEKIEKIMAYGRKANDISEISKLGQPKKEMNEEKQKIIHNHPYFGAPSIWD